MSEVDYTKMTSTWNIPGYTWHESGLWHIALVCQSTPSFKTRDEAEAYLKVWRLMHGYTECGRYRYL